MYIRDEVFAELMLAAKHLNSEIGSSELPEAPQGMKDALVRLKVAVTVAEPHEENRVKYRLSFPLMRERREIEGYLSSHDGREWTFSNFDFEVQEEIFAAQIDVFKPHRVELSGYERPRGTNELPWKAGACNVVQWRLLPIGNETVKTGI